MVLGVSNGKGKKRIPTKRLIKYQKGSFSKGVSTTFDAHCRLERRFPLITFITANFYMKMLAEFMTSSFMTLS